MKLVLPTKSLALLMAIGFGDLISTAWLHNRGMIQELNPVMRPFLEFGETPFILVKGASLLIAWYVMARYSRVDQAFVRKACLGGSLAYLALWLVWFTAGASA